MRVIFSSRSLRELARIVNTILQDNPQAAINFVAEFQHRCSLLGVSPEMGRSRPDVGRGVRSVIHGSYFVYYRIDPDSDRINILSVWHSRRLPPRL